MSIFVDENTRLLVQGITGQEGQFHTKQCIYYGTNVVAGVTPGKGGQTMREVPVFDTVAGAARATGANCSLLFVPPPMAADAIMEAIDAELDLIVAITEGIPVQEMMKIKHYLVGKKARLLGPNSPGIITPGRCKVGIMPGPIHKAGGPLGVVSRSGTLTYEVVHQLTQQGLGQSTVVGVGGDSVLGSSFIDCLAAFEADPATLGIVLIGEIGGSAEEEAAAFVERHVSKPVLAFIAGQTAPRGRQMGHVGAIVGRGGGTAAAKIKVLRQAGITVCEDLAGLGAFCRQFFSALVD